MEPAGTIFPQVPTAPTKDDALAALKVLAELITEFPFVDEASRSVALSGLLTAVSRRAMDFAFLHGVTAPAFGSGRSYLVDLFCMLATGRTAPVIPQPKAPEEFEKRLDAQLLRGVSHIAIDNIDKPLEGDKLCQILTQRFVEIRPLGSLLIVEDLRRRSILCSLDANQERPELRRFRKDPIKMVQENRESYVAAALTILRAFVRADGRRRRRV